MCCSTHHTVTSHMLQPSQELRSGSTGLCLGEHSFPLSWSSNDMPEPITFDCDCEQELLKRRQMQQKLSTARVASCLEALRKESEDITALTVEAETMSCLTRAPMFPETQRHKRKSYATSLTSRCCVDACRWDPRDSKQHRNTEQCKLSIRRNTHTLNQP